MIINNQTRRSIMLMAWDAKRTESARTFSDCLKGAWRFARKMAKATANLMARARRQGGRLRLSLSLIRSPIQRATATAQRAKWTDFKAAYTTARLGS
jgi:hypothetical protein